MSEEISRGYLIQPLAQERHFHFSGQLMQGKKKIVCIHSGIGPFLMLLLERDAVKEGNR